MKLLWVNIKDSIHEAAQERFPPLSCLGGILKIPRMTLLRVILKDSPLKLLRVNLKDSPHAAAPMELLG
jgi:hypothetical protein